MSCHGTAKHYIGDDGYLYEKLTEFKGTNEFVAFWSDDQGKTWNQDQCD